MNQELVKIIEQYLKIETNYAIIIEGDYGIGKTHFFKYTLSEKIRELSTRGNEKKKFSPIHISLFGISTIEDIQAQVFLGLFPLLTNRTAKLAYSVVKPLFRGISQVAGMGDVDKYISDFDDGKKELINYEEVVLCFDDIDRKSDALKTKDLFGFINTLVENYGSKVILILNETKFNDSESDYQDSKNKVVGVSVKYIPDTGQIFDSIIENRYLSAFSVYYEHLKNAKAYIGSVVNKSGNNFRNLIFFLEHYQIIFSSAVNYFDENQKVDYDRGRILSTLLTFTIAISFEYKSGKINENSYTDLRNINNLKSPINLDKLISGDGYNDEDKKKYFDVFRFKYVGDRSYVYYDSILKYITGQKAFNINDLMNEIGEEFDFKKEGMVPRKKELIDLLSYPNVFSLSNAEYKVKTLEIVQLVNQGAFFLLDYPVIFQFAVRFNNVLNFSIRKLKVNFKKGILKGKEKYLYDDMFNHRLFIDNDAEFKDHIIEIMQFCSKVNQSLKEKDHLKQIKELEELFLNDFESFFKEINREENQLKFKPFWNDFSVNKIYSGLIRLQNKYIFDLALYFERRYRSGYNELYTEETFLSELTEKIEKPKSRKVKNFRNAIINLLVNKMKIGIDNFRNKNS